VGSDVSRRRALVGVRRQEGIPSSSLLPEVVSRMIRSTNSRVVIVFSQKTREIFDRHAGSELILFGYEPSRSWVRHRRRCEAVGSDTSNPSS
jgi:hypothetical protein